MYKQYANLNKNLDVSLVGKYTCNSPKTDTKNGLLRDLPCRDL